MNKLRELYEQLYNQAYLGRKGKVLRSVYLPKDNGENSEVDVVFITQKGIFVFESKETLVTGTNVVNILST